MTKRESISHQYVEFIPKDLDEGVLYISRRFSTASHLCCCGCGGKVVTPLNPAKWSLIDHGSTVSLSPSIGLGTFACRSHYWIRRGRVDWHLPMSDWQTKRAQRLDEYDSKVYTGEIKPPPRKPSSGAEPRGWWSKLLAWLGLR